ncbi:M20 family metallopeptidase [Clostridium aminobutyricum]|uniref:M20 family metallopeptidase n=1 Tax=Clostridium aminobutyricum TaxID=33953 RepID=A0A939IKB4_CLOAM|nr:M20 family metallopeptidase [Clostridium aminobutyricum]MBN7774434.1 M20 family metallopeptidase [Clostridium aminobutyricum]
MFTKKIEQMKDQMITSLQECIRIESVNTGKSSPEIQRALAYTLELAEHLGFEVKNIEDKVGYAQYGQGEEMIAVLAHLDVVAAGEGWSYPPFGGEIHDGKIFGRGVLDDKGAAIGALYALKAIADSNVALNRRIRIIFGTSEETGGDDIARYKQTEELPVMGFTPDAEYPVIFAEKGIINVVYAKKLNQGHAESVLEELVGGEAPNVVPSYVSAIISEKGAKSRLEAFGKTAHGSTPEKGKNAISELLSQLKQIPFCEELHQFIQFIHNRIGVETDGKGLGIHFQDEVSGALTVNVGTIKLEGDEIKVCLDIRYPVTADFEYIKSKLQEAADENNLQMHIVRHKKSLYIPENSTLVEKLQGVYEKETGQKVPPMSTGGGTYAKEMENIVAFGMLFPEQEDVMHQKDEYMSIEDLIKNVKIMASAMYELAK